MIVTEVREMEEQMLGFEVRLFLLGSRGYTVKILRAIPKVCIIREPRFLSRLREAQFCEFELCGCIFKVWEPLWDRDYTRRSLWVRHIITTDKSAICKEYLELIRHRFIAT